METVRYSEDGLLHGHLLFSSLLARLRLIAGLGLAAGAIKLSETRSNQSGFIGGGLLDCGHSGKQVARGSGNLLYYT